MIKKIVLIIIITCILMFSMNRGVSAATAGSDDSIISIRLGDYREYLQNNPPLDRLYIKDDAGFFLVHKNELETVEHAGVTILSREPAEDLIKRIQPDEGLASATGDVNGAFHSYNETRTMLNDLAARYPTMARVVNLGYSIEGRKLNALKISDNANAEENEPNVYIMGCHHAREWVSVEVPLLFAKYLLEHYADNADVRRAVNGTQVYIIPIMNPDGLEFSIHTYRMWRKNRRYNGDLVWGVDTNRNYGYKWGIDNMGSSPNPSDEIYRGAAAFSEPETDAVRRFLLTRKPAGVISYHSYGQDILYPWGYTYLLTPDNTKLQTIAAEMSNLIYHVNGRSYTYGAATTLYITNGDTSDWVYGTFRAPAFTIELPPIEYENGGFFSPETLIDSTFNENLPALLYFVNYFVGTDVQEKENPVDKEMIRALKKEKQ